MPILPIITYPDERLKKVAEPVDLFDDSLRLLITDLEQTMRAGPGGVGIAATQTGKLVQVAIVDVSSRPKIKNHGRLVLVNPEIVSWDGFAIGREGCMSVPDFTGNVIRAERIDLVCFDEHGTRHEYTMEGFEARAVQHEIDHLDGLLFLDRLVSRRRDLFKRKVYKAEEENPTD